jgi:hypothetical protein
MNGVKLARHARAAAGRLWDTARVLVTDVRHQCGLADIAPLILPLLLLPWIGSSFAHFVHHTLYFDPINYQYTAWCVRHGERLYDTVGVPDGPFITMLHAFVQILVGQSDAAFRCADLWIHTVGAAMIGLAVAPAPSVSAEPGRAFVVRVVWALVAASLWLSYYLTFDWQWTIQREAYYSLFGYLGVALLYVCPTYRARAGRTAAFVGGVLAGMQLLGKHTGLIFVACGLAAVAFSDRTDRGAWRARLYAALVGVGAGVFLMLACVVVWGSLRGFWFWYLRFPFAYRNAMTNTDAAKLFLEGDTGAQELSVYALVGGLTAVALKLLPRRAVGLAVAPMAFFGAMALQRKGYPYHLHPVYAGVCLLVLISLAALWRRGGRWPTDWTKTHAIVAAVSLAVVGAHAVGGLRNGPWLHPPDWDANTKGPGMAVLDYPSLRDVARFLDAHTKPGDRIFTYGNAPEILFKAERPDAVPEFDSYFFNIRRATTGTLDPAQRRSLDTLQAAVQADACPRLRRRPAAMIFCDGAEWSWGPGIDHASEICPEIRPMVSKEYRLSHSVGCWRVYLRNELASAPAGSG